MLADVVIFEQKLDAAIKSALENEVADIIRDEMSKHLESYSYTRSRGQYGGGVRDKRNFTATCDHPTENTYELTVKDVAQFQEGNIGNGKSLAEVVETGDRQFKMPMPRPFIAPTQDAIDGGLAESALAVGMAKRGLIVT